MANSSPPSRAARSPVADRRPDPVGDGDQELVAGRVAERVVDDLEVVEVEEQDDRDPVVLAIARDGGRPARRTGPGSARSGQRVVVGLVAELLLEPGELGQRLLELPVLERDADLVGERLEQAQVVVAEARPLGQPVGDSDRADDPGLADERATIAWRIAIARPPGVRWGIAKNARRSAAARVRTGSPAGRSTGIMTSASASWSEVVRRP